MRILCDQNIMAETVEYIRSLEHDVVSTRETGLASATDEEILRVAVNQDRILLTYNADFSDIRIFPVGTHTGIIRLRLQEQTAEDLHPVLSNLFRQLAGKDIAGKLITVTKTTIRIRSG